MEKKKNNAVEKAEKVADKNQKATAKNNKKDKAKKSVKARAKSEKAKQREKIRAEKKAEKARLKEQRERELAEKRLELARLKAHRKAEKQKAKATALREKNRRRAEAEKRRMEIKAERQARREMLKNETKKQRHERIMEEKRAKREERIQRRQSVLAEKRARREQKSIERRERKERNKGYGGWLSAVISLGVATLVLSSVLTFTFLMPTQGDNMLESAYRKSFFDTVEQVNNIDLNLSKALATADTGAMQKYLVDTAINSELAENDIQQLPLQDESKYYTTKVVNQIGDYAKYINNKIISGEKLSESDYQGLVQLYRANAELKEGLSKMREEMSGDFSFSTLMDGGDGNLVINGFNQLQNLSVQYPELIYDGPFSDGLDRKEIKGLNGAEIDQNIALEKFTQIFGEYQLENIMVDGSSNAQMECYNVQGEKDGDILYAEISKKGGKLVMFSFAGSCNGVNKSEEQAQEIAEQFVASLGIENMKPVWINLSNNVYTINFAYEQNGIIVYSDLVKVRVCGETGMVIGLEGTSYYTNHTQRVISKPVLTKSQAQSKVSSSILVEGGRLVVVPIGQKSEKLCYEFVGEYDGSIFYAYIDAISGRQVEMFKVVESTEGKLLA
ncbi:MAG: germination protein YpeB [Clostridia bacterium]|nr:germination protein YpeB [Clostridia bacterium]